MSESDQRDFVQSLARGLDVLLAFSNDHPKMTLSECAHLCGLPRPTVRRTLLTLQRLGYVRGEGRHFSLTPQVLRFAYAYLSALDLPKVVQPYMEALVAQTGEACTLATLDGADVVYLSRESRRPSPPSFVLVTGTRLPAHATAMGHVLLAGLDAEALHHYLLSADLRPLTARTIRSAEDLVDRLKRTRSQGWAMVEQELEDGVRSVAVPVRGPDDRVIAALGMSCLVESVSEERMRVDFAPTLMHAAAQISERLGAGLGGGSPSRLPAAPVLPTRST
jgi:IclR family pca regulon transcriptional regulator